MHYNNVIILLLYIPMQMQQIKRETKRLTD